MTKAAPSLNLPQGSETAEIAGVVARTTGEILVSSCHEVSAILRDLDRLHPLRARLEEIGNALETARELNLQVVDRLGLAAQHAKVTGRGWEAGVRPLRALKARSQAMVALVVESDRGLRRLMGEVIRKQGYRVLEASTAEEAESVVAKTPYAVDTLVTEVLISGMSGVALGCRLRLLQPHMGIVYTVCEAHEAVVPRGAMGEARVLRKPFTVAGLSGALKGAEAE